MDIRPTPAAGASEGMRSVVPARYGPLSDSIPDPVLALDRDACVGAINIAAFAFLGLEQAGAVGSDLCQRIADGDRRRFRTTIAEYIDGRAAPSQIEITMLGPGDEAVAVDASIGRHRTRDFDGVILVLRDVRDRLLTQENLELRVALLDLIVRISSHLDTQDENLDAGIHDAQAELGRFVRADRSYVFEMAERGRLMTCAFEWHASGAGTRRGVKIHESHLPWFAAEVATGRVVDIASVDQLPATATSEAAYMRELGVGSLLLVPMMSQGRLLGVLGFNAAGAKERWIGEATHTVPLLVECFTSALRRRSVGRRLRRVNRLLEAVTACNDALVRATDERQLLLDVCRVVVETSDYAIAWVGFAEDETGPTGVAVGYGQASDRRLDLTGPAGGSDLSPSRRARTHARCGT